MVDEEIIGGLASSRFITSGTGLGNQMGNGIYFTKNEILIAKNKEIGENSQNLNMTKIFFGIISILIGIPIATFLFPNNRFAAIFLVLIFIWISLDLASRIVKLKVDRVIPPLSEIIEKKLDEIPINDIKNIELFLGYEINPMKRSPVIKIILNDNSTRSITINPYPDDGEFAYLTELFQKVLPEKTSVKKSD